ncbi:hypothetical protein [Candidatus Nitrotoga sp. 1052]|uniref:hypothetical protein n=1 Tax=Candidatus Nitrotoga sp. 1052 TaxID=2886964 RepID=UPI001EF5335C|nr:hypothetical protein [Candidatus Nitrotoga sp. 1052]CAH1082957.1 EF hand [Candidatus Nitrotoga sp. 1052]
MKKTFSYLAITSCFVLGTTLSHADSDASHGNMQEKIGNMQEKMFKAMDANSDGMVTTDEFNAFHAKKFKELDVNGNGQITLEEMKAGYKKMMDDSGRKKMMDDGGRKKMDDAWHKKTGDAEGKKMDDSEMDSDSGKTDPQRGTANPKSETRAAGGSSDSCCWTPRDSGTNRSDKKMDDKD